MNTPDKDLDIDLKLADKECDTKTENDPKTFGTIDTGIDTVLIKPISKQHNLHKLGRRMLFI